MKPIYILESQEYKYSIAMHFESDRQEFIFLSKYQSIKKTIIR